MIRRMLGRLLTRSLGSLGFSLVPAGFPADFTASEIEIIRAVSPFTMTSPEKLVSLIHAVEYISRADIPGTVVECGVWRGGSMMAAAMTLLRLERDDRELFLFDTYEGMPDPGPEDKDWKGESAGEALKRYDRHSLTDHLVARSPLETVMANMSGTRYPSDRIHFVKGKVEDTVPLHAPETISLLRLDTDWYESTRHELLWLFPRVHKGGVVIFDDYGHWAGSRKAIDEYLADNGLHVLLHRVDSSARSFVKV